MAIDIISIFVRGGELFAAPFKDLNLLWIIIPIYLTWIVTEFYQEKKGTSLGNAVTNGVLPLWVGIDWGRKTMDMLSSGQIGVDSLLVTKIIIIIFMIIYGLIILVEGIRARPITKYIGRIREVTFFCVVFTPVIYGIVPSDVLTLLAIAIFFPIFYLIVEVIDRVTPTPIAYDEEQMPSGGSNIPDFGEMKGGKAEKFEDLGPGFGELPPMQGGGQQGFPPINLPKM